MLYRSHTPGMPLAAHVDHLWMLSDVPAHPHERVVPSGTLELVINLAEDEFRIYDPTDARRIRRYSGAVISGAFSRCFGIDTREHASIVGVHFKPGGAYPFLGLPLHELADSHVDLETLWGLEARGLRDRLTPVRHHPAVSEALAQLSQRAVPVGDLARQSGLSHRRFIELFRAEVGMAPKRFSRLRRFERAAVYARSNTPDWARLALDCGYFDQSHMIADFLAFSGFTPAQFLGRATPAVKDGHVIG
jgi:AraC-like DNA-binding protein